MRLQAPVNRPTDRLTDRPTDTKPKTSAKMMSLCFLAMLDENSNFNENRIEFVYVFSKWGLSDILNEQGS